MQAHSEYCLAGSGYMAGGLWLVMLASYLAATCTAQSTQTTATVLPGRAQPSHRAAECHTRLRKLQFCRDLPQEAENDVRACCAAVSAFNYAGCFWCVRGRHPSDVNSLVLNVQDIVLYAC